MPKSRNRKGHAQKSRARSEKKLQQRHKAIELTKQLKEMLSNVSDPGVNTFIPEPSNRMMLTQSENNFEI
jgi:hypothetical protein